MLACSPLADEQGGLGLVYGQQWQTNHGQSIDLIKQLHHDLGIQETGDHFFADAAAGIASSSSIFSGTPNVAADIFGRIGLKTPAKRSGILNAC